MSVNWRSYPVDELEADLTIPGDKSISHRAIMLAALAEGTTTISNWLDSEDCKATLRAFELMGVTITRQRNDLITVIGKGLHALTPANCLIDVGNSGTSMRLMSGILAAQTFASTISGDESLLKRPMQRIIAPLRQMGAVVSASDGDTAPLNFKPSKLRAIDYVLPVASAQLKSCLMLAALYANGTTTIGNCATSRDHSERMLAAFGAQIGGDGATVTITGGQKLTATNIDVAGDISSAAFLIVAALIAKRAKVRINNVGINPTRSAIIDILRAMGAKLKLLNCRENSGEPVADIEVYSSKLHGIAIDPKYVSIAIDEFPIIFIAAACANGTTSATNLQELRVKECDRLTAMAAGLSALGIKCTTGDAEISIEGGNFTAGSIDSFGDHRIAMSFAVAAIAARGAIDIANCANVATSFPSFATLCNTMGMHIEVLRA